MRVVLDTNVVISGFLWHGAPYDILKAASWGTLSAVTSFPLLDELSQVLSRKKFVPILKETGFLPDELRKMYESFCEIVIPAVSKEVIVVADPKDDVVVLTAENAHASFVVSGNAHLLKLKLYKWFDIVTPADFLKIHSRHTR